MRDITMSNTDPRVIINVKHPPYCYQEVEAYDIESDGSTGSLPVPGTLMRNFDTKISCTSKNSYSKLSFFPLSSIKLLVPGTAVLITTVVILTVSLIFVMLVVVVIVVYKIKRLKRLVVFTKLIQTILSSTYTEVNCWSLIILNLHIPPQLIIIMMYHHFQITFRRSLMVERERLALHWKSYHCMTYQIIQLENNKT